MKTANNMKIKALTLAVEGVFLAMCAMPAHADDAEANALKTPTNSAELGLSSTSKSSAKFGEFSGMNKSGGDVIGNIGLRGGDAYGGGEGTRRWSFTATDIGLTSRNLDATMSDQGKWNFSIGYDELRRNLSDSYQTPYSGRMGGNTFTLPAVITGLPTAAPGTRTLTAAQLATFNKMDISTTRENLSILGGLRLNSQWDLKVDYNHLDQSGARLMAFGSYGSAGATAPFIAVGGAGTGEKISILPMPTDFKTDTVTVALNWTGDKAHATGSYHGSFFRDSFNGVTFQTFTGASNLQTMGTPPSNDFHQLNLMGGYSLSSRTKLTGGLSYSRNTQDVTYAYDKFAMVSVSPTASLGGAVVNTHADIKLTDQTSKDLTLSASLKYDNRNNRTASNIYNFNAIDGGNTALYPNTPLSIKKTQMEMAADYRIDKDQKIRVAFNHDHVRRWCDSYAVNALYPIGTNCVVATATSDNKIGATYRLNLNEAVSANFGYSLGTRLTDYDTYARAAFISTNGNVIVNGATIKGINGGDYLGFHPYIHASKKDQTVKGGINWQATEKLSVLLGARYSDERYDTQYGVQRAGSSGMNLDSTYAHSEDTTVSAYVTQQYSRRDVLDLARSPTAIATPANNTTTVLLPSGGTWSNYLRNADTTLGMNLKQTGLMGGKLELLTDLTYSLGTSQYQTNLNYYTTTTLGLDCNAPTILSCGALPIIRNSMLQFKLTGTYKIDKSAKVMVGFIHQSLKSDDYKYNAYQYLSTPTGVMPTNETSGSYAVNVVSATYQYDFR